MKQIQLTGRHAAGDNRFALVDDDAFPELSRYAWKAKPNGCSNHVYAVRNMLSPAGRWVTVRMHREVLGYSGPLDVDHINRNALDNRRQNLRVVSRAQNCQNRGRWSCARTCPGCGAVSVGVYATSGDRVRICDPCRAARDRVGRERVAPMVRECGQCSATFVAAKPWATFCSEACRKKTKRARQQAGGTLPPSQLPEVAADRSARWRAASDAGGSRYSPGGQATGSSDLANSLVTGVFEGGCSGS